MAPGVIKVLESFKKVVKVIKSSKSSKSSKGSKGSGKGWGPGPGRAQPGPPRLAQQSPGALPRASPGRWKRCISKRISVFLDTVVVLFRKCLRACPRGAPRGCPQEAFFFLWFRRPLISGAPRGAECDSANLYFCAYSSILSLLCGASGLL